MRSSALTLLVSSLLVASATAQIAQPGQPASLRSGGALPDPALFVVPRPDIAALMTEDEVRGHWPYRYGAVVPLGLSCNDSGVWDVSPTGELVWRLRLRAPGALSLAVLFQRFELPETGAVYLYDPQRSTQLGAFTRASRQPNGMLAVQPVRGDDLVIEYVQDALDPGQPELVIGEVVHDYRGILDRLGDGTMALGSGCLVDINCPSGLPYQDIKRSVIMVIAGGSLCSAGMLNNTAQDGTPYFLTANHCGNMTNVVAVFEYENSGCDTNDASQSKTISGATLLAASTPWDSQLYRLSSAPPQSYHPYYAGWDRVATQGGFTVSISHPYGNPHKLAKDNDRPLKQPTRYQTDWELGVIQPGSSGSPLFNKDLRVIGPACCVTNFNCNNQWAFYGRFSGFWGPGHLAQWLDPLGTGTTGIDAYDPFNGQAVIYNGTSFNPIVYTSNHPTLGTTWIGTIDTTIAGMPVNTRLIGHLAPTSGTLGSGGEILVDVTSPHIFTSYAFSSGGIATHSALLPNTPSLSGLVIYTQALMLAGGPLQLTNGLELHLR